MIQFVLYFALGFLCAVLIALSAAPAIWRRAEVLTRRRIEASLPMTSDEIAAERDRLRADHAMSVRRIEIELGRVREKSSRQAVQNARMSSDLADAAAERDERQAAVVRLEADREELEAKLADQERAVATLGERLAAAAERIEADAAETERLAGEAEEQTLLASQRQIAILTLESDVERLRADLAGSASARKDAERRTREVMADNKAGQEALRNERRRIAEAEKKIERLMATLSDREDKLERRERERSRLRDDGKDGDRRRRETEAQLAEARAEILRLEAEIAAGFAPGFPGTAATQEDAPADRRHMEERLTLLTRENRKLRAELASDRIVADLAAGADDDALRAEIAELAARIVRATAEAEGPASPIHAALAETPPTAPDLPTSLAQRINARLDQPAGAS